MKSVMLEGMTQLSKAINSIKANPTEHSRTAVSGVVNGRKVTIRRSLEINSHTMLPTMDITIFLDDVYCWKTSGTFITNAEMSAINLAFSEIQTLLFKVEDKKRDATVEEFDKLFSL